MSQTYSTIHIFGFGIVQVIGKNFNYQVKTSQVQTQADACINEVYSKKPTDSTTTNQYHAINIFNESFADWMSGLKIEKGFRINYSDLNSQVFETLAQDVIALANNQTP